jgi:simple sugar transport system permease protein
VYLGIIIVIISNIVLFKTNIGLKIRAVGENPEAADSLGIPVERIRFACVIIGGLLVGLGGLYLSIAESHIFSDHIVAGRGWIAYIIVMFGRWSPYKILGASLLFGFVSAIQLRIQVILGVAIPYQLVLMMPYILALIVLVLSSRGTLTSAPEALGRPYKRGEK